MAKEQNVSVNLSSVPKEPYGAAGEGPNSSFVSSPVAMPVEPEEERAAPSSTGCPGGGTSVEHEEVVPEEGPEASKSPSVKSKSPPELSSSSPESDLELGAQYQMTAYKSKDYSVSLSPERAIGVKRRLWDVDRKEVDDSLTRELKRIRQEDSIVKSSKWNFDFEKDVPMSGTWVWEKTESPPDFYRTKECPRKKTHRRYSPYERSGAVSQSVSSTSLPHTSSASLVTSSRELTSLLSAVSSSSVSTPEASTKECVGSSAVHSSSVSSEESDVAQGSKVLTRSSSAAHSISKATTSSIPDIPSPDYLKPSSPLLEEQRPCVEDIPKTSFSVSSSTSTASSSSVSNNGSSCVSSSSSSGNKINTEASSKISSTLPETSSKNGSSSSGLEASRTSSLEHGIDPAQFYSSEASETQERGEQGADSSRTSKSSSSAVKPKEKRTLKAPKPSSSGDSSPSHLLKYYR